MENTTTTEELKESLYNNIHWDENSAMEFAIEFAKIHVEKALKEASEKANMILTALTADGGDYDVVCETLILNSYPLDNIK
jgi:hypothetical protein